MPGESVLNKHSTYRQFLEIATPMQKTYPVLIGKRHPLDKATTVFARTMNSRGCQFSDVVELQEQFEAWFCNRLIYREGHRSLEHIKDSYPLADHMISQEHLIQDVKNTLNSIAVDFVNIHKWKRTTDGKLSNYLQYYSKSLIPLAVKTFKYEMELLNYEVPTEWKNYLD